MFRHSHQAQRHPTRKKGMENDSSPFQRRITEIQRSCRFPELELD